MAGIRTVRQMAPAPAFEATTALGHFFGLRATRQEETAHVH
jgi:hypothetical protein